MNVGTATSPQAKQFTNTQIARTIDHTILKSTAKESEIRTGAEVTRTKNLRALVVRQYFVPLVKSLLTGSNSLCAAVCDFPDGMDTTENRTTSLNAIYKDGANEVDIVSKYHLLLDGNQPEFEKDLRAVIKAANNRLFKIILETDYLTEEQIRLAVQTICDIAKELKSRNLIVKTNTGYAKEVKTENIVAVRIIKETLIANGVYAEKIEAIANGKIGIKASRGIKTKENAISLLNEGAHILGTSSGDTITEG